MEAENRRFCGCGCRYQTKFPRLKPRAWGLKRSPPHYLDHNILYEPLKYDKSFRVDFVATEQMRRRANHTTNDERHSAIMGCAVAFSRFMRRNLPTAQWWLDAGTLIAVIRGGRYIPWDDDADVSMTNHSWADVQRYLRNQTNAARLPVDDPGPSCGCVLLDTKSFGSSRYNSLKHDGSISIPGRVVNECTGNYVDIFTVSPVPSDSFFKLSKGGAATGSGVATWALSQPAFKPPFYLTPQAIQWPAPFLFPPKSCKLDGHKFLCPSMPRLYIDGLNYSTPWAHPDKKWSHQTHSYIKVAPPPPPPTAAQKAAILRRVSSQLKKDLMVNPLDSQVNPLDNPRSNQITPPPSLPATPVSAVPRAEEANGSAARRAAHQRPKTATSAPKSAAPLMPSRTDSPLDWSKPLTR